MFQYFFAGSLSLIWLFLHNFPFLQATIVQTVLLSIFSSSVIPWYAWLLSPDVSTSFFLSVFFFLPPICHGMHIIYIILHGSHSTVSLDSKWFLLFSFISTLTHKHTQETDIFLPESGLVLTAILINSAHIHHSTSLAASTSSGVWKTYHCFTRKEIHMTILWQNKGYSIRNSLNLLTFTKKQ